MRLGPLSVIPLSDDRQDEVRESFEILTMDFFDERVRIGAGPGERDVDAPSGEKHRTVVSSPGISDLDGDAAASGER